MTDKLAELVRGEIATGGFDGQIPEAAILRLSRALVGLWHGTATLTLHVRDGRLARYNISGDESLIRGPGGFDGEIPTAAIVALHWRAAGLHHGLAWLTLRVRNGVLDMDLSESGRDESFIAGPGKAEAAA